MTQEQVNKVAVEEQLSAVMQLRIDLDTYDELFSIVNAHMKDEEWLPFEAAQDKLYSAVDDNLHLLFDHIDAQAAEITRLRGELEAAKLVHKQLGNVLYNSKQDPTMKRMTDIIESILDNAGWDKS